jgi:hypothetical protein
MPLPDVLLLVCEISITKSVDLLQGTLNLLILKILEVEPLHGWAAVSQMQSTAKAAICARTMRPDQCTLPGEFSKITFENTAVSDLSGKCEQNPMPA